MRKLIALLAVVGFANQALADNHTHSGSFRAYYQNDSAGQGDWNENDGGQTQDIYQRLMWGHDYKVSDNVSVHATLLHHARWGTNADQYPGDRLSSVTTNARSGNTVTVQEAYATWNISDDSMIRFGRGSLTVGDGRVVSANTWEQVNKAFDGIMYTKDHEVARVNFFGVRGGTQDETAYSAQTNPTNNSGNFYGVSADIKSLPSFLKMANVHYLVTRTDTADYVLGDGTVFPVSAAAEERGERAGITLGGDAAGFDYNLTYALQMGEVGSATTTDIDASMMDLTVGYSMPTVKNLRVSAQYHTDSGTDGSGDVTQYRGFHYDIHNNAGLMDVFQYGNLTFLRAGVTLDIKEDLTFGADYYMFTATETGATAFNITRVGGNHAIANAGDDELGSEIDVYVTKRYGSNFSAQVRYGQFDPGARLAASGDAWTQMYLEGMMTF